MPRTIVNLDRWKRQACTDPEGSARELTEALIAGSAWDCEMENLAWRVIADRAPSERLALSILARVRPGAGWGEPLRVVAREVVEAHVFDRGERERIAADPLRLVEVGFVVRRRPIEAAALWALEHERMGDDPGAGEAGVSEPAVALACLGLRYRLARSLHRAGGFGQGAGAVMETAIALLDRLGGSDRASLPPELRPTFVLLSFHAREWLGLRRYEAGRHAEAERWFRQAAAIAPASDLELAVLAFAADALIARGERGAGRCLVEAVRDQAARMESS